MTDQKKEVQKKPVRLVGMPSSCKKGEHTFIVTVWQVSSSKKKASIMKCQHCLMQIEMNEASQNWVVSEPWRNQEEN